MSHKFAQMKLFDAAEEAEKRCSVEGCCDVVRCKGFCSKHYSRFRKHGAPDIILKKQGTRNQELSGLKFGRLYVVKESRDDKGKRAWLCICDCGELVIAYTQHITTGHKKSCGCLARDILKSNRIAIGETISRYKARKKSERLKGVFTKRLTSGGYVGIYFPEHPNSNRSGNIGEHILVMSNHIGRPLIKGETVHHINGQRTDNRIENLQLMSSSHPAGQRVEDKLKWAMEILHTYGLKEMPVVPARYGFHLLEDKLGE